jgi:hypothetical protein
MIAYEYASLRAAGVPDIITVPHASRWNQMGPVNAGRAATGDHLFLNATGVALSCTHKYIMHGHHTDDIKIYVHVNMLFPAVLVRNVPMQDAVLTVTTSLHAGNPFAPERSKRQATVLIKCTTMAGNIVYSGTFKDSPLKHLHFRAKVLKTMVDTGSCSCNTRLQFVVGTKPLRGNALVWKGSTKETTSRGEANRVVGGEVKKKQLKLQSFTTN